MAMVRVCVVLEFNRLASLDAHSCYIPALLFTSSPRPYSASLTYTEHGITGDVLCALDNETLVDLGMSSLGHRLNVLRAVFEMKKEQGVEMSEDDWRPQGELRDCFPMYMLTVRRGGGYGGDGDSGNY